MQIPDTTNMNSPQIDRYLSIAERFVVTLEGQALTSQRHQDLAEADFVDRQRRYADWLVRQQKKPGPQVDLEGFKLHVRRLLAPFIKGDGLEEHYARQIAEAIAVHTREPPWSPDDNPPI